MREGVSLPKNIEKSVRCSMRVVLGPDGADGSVAMHVRGAKGQKNDGAAITVIRDFGTAS
jgi:hypothetical protein